MSGTVHRWDEARAMWEGSRQAGQATGMQAQRTKAKYVPKGKVPLQVNAATGTIGTHQSRMDKSCKKTVTMVGRWSSSDGVPRTTTRVSWGEIGASDVEMDVC